MPIETPSFARLCELWTRLRGAPGQEAASKRFELIRAARRALGPAGDREWDWFREALKDDRRKWFVAEVFKTPQVRRQLFYAMIQAGIDEPDPSFCRAFIEPMVRTDPGSTLHHLLQHLTSPSAEYQQQVLAALHWAVPKDAAASRGSGETVVASLMDLVVTSDSLDVQAEAVRLLTSRWLPSDRSAPEWRAVVDRIASHPDPYIRARTADATDG